MSFLVQLAIFVATVVLAYLLRPRIDQTLSPGDFTPPEPREGEPIQVVFGTAKVAGNITWFDDVEVREVTETKKALFGLISEEILVGFEYFAGMMFTISWGPVDELVDIVIGDYFLSEQSWGSVLVEGEGFTTGVEDPTDPLLPIPGATDPTPIRINTPELFGGETQGGVEGRLDFHWGSVEQGPNPYLSVFWPADILPHYRRVCYAVLRRMNLGKSPAPQPWWFVVRRIPDVLGQTSFADIDGDANPVEIIYEVITDDFWGLGRSADLIDLAAFQAVGQTLAAEGLGVSMVLRNQSEAAEVIRNVLEHINGVLYQDPETGLITIKLIRDDWTLGALPRLTPSDGRLESFRRGSWRETVNETRVRYTDRGRRFTTATAQAQNLASVQAMGEVISQTVDLPGLSNHDTAQEASERRNRSSSVPRAQGRFVADRGASLFHEGKPFVLDWPPRGIEMVCRVGKVDHGTLVDGAVTIKFVQDVWDLSGVAFGDPDGPTLDPCGPLNLLVPGYDPADDPSADYGDGQGTLFEAPYWHVGQARRAWASVSRSTATEVHWEPHRSEQGLAFVDLEQQLPFDPVGLLDDELPATTAATGVTLTLRNLGELRSLVSTDAAGRTAGDRLAMIGSEIIAWETIVDNGDGTYTLGGVMRGQLDTVPERHVLGERVFFYFSADVSNPGHHDISSTDYADFTSVALLAARVESNGTQPTLEEIAALTVLLSDRAFAPYPPGKVELNGSGYASWPASIVGDATLTWVDRSRVDQTEMIAQDDATAFTREGTVDIEALIEGAVARQWLIEPSNTVVYTLAERQSDDADLSKRVQFRITPRGASGEVGTIRTTPPFIMNSP